jgi:hypothetical protein
MRGYAREDAAQASVVGSYLNPEVAEVTTRNVYRALIAAGWTALDSRTDPRAYADASGKRFGTVEKDGVRLSLSIDELLAEHRGEVIVYSSCDTYDVILRAIIVDEPLRGSGRAGRAFAELVRMADLAVATVYLEPVPIADKIVPKNILSRFYQRFGFQFISDSNRVMIRVPLGTSK